MLHENWGFWGKTQRQKNRHHKNKSRLKNVAQRKASLSFEQLEDRSLLAVNVLSFRNDLAANGVNSAESQLAPSNVVPNSSFGKLFTTAVDGQIYAEPLIDTGVTIQSGPFTTAGAAGIHDVVYVATEHDSVYAIDSNLTAAVRILWQRNFLDVTNPNNVLPGTTAVKTFTSAFDVVPEVGITGTPVIDPTSGALYVVTKTEETVGGVVHYVARLHALNISDGTDLATPYLIGDSIDTVTNNTQIYVYGNSDGTDTVIDPYNNTGKKVVQFNALREFQRCALSLVNNTLYVEWAGHNDTPPYHGWITTWNVAQIKTTGFKLNGVFTDSPNGGQAGIWEGGGTLSFEPDASAFYFETGNGPGAHGNVALDANGFPVGGNYYEALVKVAPDATSTPTNQNVNGWGMKVIDYFIPFDQAALDNTDADFGSGGPLVLPASAGIPNHPNLILAAGKQGKLYVMDRNNLGKYDPLGDHVVNAIPDGSGHNTPPVLLGGSLSTPSYFNGKIYWVAGYENVAKIFTLGSDGTLTPTSQTVATNGVLPGSVMISSAGTTNGIAWIMDRHTNVIHAYDAGSLATELWNSNMKQGSADAVGAVTKMAVPTIANSSVFVGTQTSLVVYGSQPPADSPPLAPVLSAAPLSNSSVNLFWSDPSQKPNVASGYSVENSLDGITFTPVTTALGSATTISVGGLANNTKYYFRMRGFNGIGNSVYSNIVSATTSSQIAAIDFTTGFGSATASNLTRNGNATINGTRLELTSGLSSQNSSAFGPSLVDITKFNTQFTFNLSSGAILSDGFTFCIQGVAPTALGAGGGGLGFAGIAKSMAVKFDLFDSQGEGFNSTGLFTNGFTPSTPAIDLTSSGIDLHSGDVFLVKMNYDGTTLTVIIQDTNTGAQATQTYTVNIPAIVGKSTAYVGFTGSTGFNISTQDILNWSYTPNTPVAPSAPSALGATPATATSVNLTWTNNATNQTGFRLDRANDVNFTQSLITVSLPATPNSYTDANVGLAPGTTYYYRLRANNNAGDSGNSNVATVTIPVAPPTPTNAVVTGVTTSEIDLEWTDNAGRLATGYLIQRRAGAAAFTNYATLPAENATSPVQYAWSDTNVTPGTYYEYHIVAFNTSGNNDFTGTNTTTLTLPPSNFTVLPSFNNMQLSWTSVSGAIAYNIYRGTAAGAETLLAGGLTTNTYTDPAPSSGATFYYVVTALNANLTPFPNESAKSIEVQTTLPLAASYTVTVPPDIAVGHFANYAITVTNLGTTTWLATGTNAMKLAAYFSGRSDAIGDWTSEPARFNLPSNVPPLGSVTLNIPLAAPAVAGNYVLRQRLVQETVAWFSQLTSAPVRVENLAATYVATPPTTWELGATYSYPVTFTNTGTDTWPAAGVNAVHAVSYADGTSDAVGAWATEPKRISLPNDVAPGQSVTVTMAATTPNAVGNYTLRTRLVKEGVSWFDQLLKTPLTQPVLAAGYVSSPPLNWFSNQPQTYSLTVTNIGTQTWNASGTNPVHIGVYFGTTNDAVGAWSAEPKRISLPNDLAPGQSATVTISLTAPVTGGSYVLRHRMVKENVAWFTYQQKTNVTVLGLSATYVATPPITWTTGTSATFPVKITNSGSVTWNATGTNVVHLAAYFGTASDAVGAWTSEPPRFNLPSDLAPGASATVNVTIAAPTTAGSYVFRLRMVKENVAWFADMQKTTVTVNAPVALAKVAAVAPAATLLATATGSPPVSIAAASTLAMDTTLLNTGSAAWKSSGASRVRLVAYLTPSSAAAPLVTDPASYSFYITSDVAAGRSFTNKVSLIVPSIKGTYTLRLRLLGDDGSFSNFLLSSNVNVV